MDRTGMEKRKLIFSILWNLSLITSGSILFSVGIKAVAVHHGFVTGGLFGASLLLHYSLNFLPPGIWYFLINIPIFIISYLYVGRRFFLYSLYCMVVITIATALIELDFGIHNQLYAAIAAGILCGAGGGTILRSLGSGGGLDVIAVVLNRSFNIGFGKFYFAFNCVLFSFCFIFLEADLCIASLILLFVSAMTLDYVLSLFSQRKLVYIISDRNAEIGERIIGDLQQGATFIKARGAYSGRDKEVLMTITNNLQLRKLEEIVFTTDANAVFIVENTMGVIGSSFSRRKVY